MKKAIFAISIATFVLAGSHANAQGVDINKVAPLQNQHHGSKAPANNANTTKAKDTVKQAGKVETKSLNKPRTMTAR